MWTGQRRTPCDSRSSGAPSLAPSSAAAPPSFVPGPPAGPAVSARCSLPRPGGFQSHPSEPRSHEGRWQSPWSALPRLRPALLELSHEPAPVVLEHLLPLWQLPQKPPGDSAVAFSPRLPGRICCPPPAAPGPLAGTAAAPQSLPVGSRSWPEDWAAQPRSSPPGPESPLTRPPAPPLDPPVAAIWRPWHWRLPEGLPFA
mmetsp:Transcript_20908/g.34817  ORF Transcript_20908/g.34817 Transcript_20908/m.34817 type:complete len:200 (-) Transcript_20908:520-1119(-)